MAKRFYKVLGDFKSWAEMDDSLIGIIQGDVKNLHRHLRRLKKTKNAKK